MGKNLVFVPECPSTNTLALQISQQSPVDEGTLVIAGHQTAGKGQRGNVWEAEAGKNLTFSLILRPKFLAVDKQFYLNIVICLALKDYLMEKIADTVYIKWPNDILVHERKISGVLIENLLKGAAIAHSVAGLGVNINQQQFETETAISLGMVTGQEYDLNDELHFLLACVEKRYLQLRQGHYGLMMDLYLAGLYRRREKHKFASADGNVFEGEIEDLDESGRLRVKVDGEVKVFGMKEIRYM